MAQNRGDTDTITVRRDSRWRGKVAHDFTHTPIHDVVCIGFGCSAISLAIALEEVGLGVDVLFLERQHRSTYVAFNRLPGSSMQLSFLNDLVTLENPRSKFSYINYLHSTGQLIQFTNLGCLQPLREQFARYLGWCADHFQTKVRFGSEAQSVRPVRIRGSSVDAWSAEYLDVETGLVKTVLAKQIVYAGGPQTNIPSIFSNPDISSSVSHSSNSLDLLCALEKDLSNQYHVAVVGDNQEAAEAVERICNMSNSHQVTWIQETSQHAAGTIDQSLSDRLYELQYAQRVSKTDPREWRLRTNSNVHVKSASPVSGGKIQLSYTGSEGSSRCADTVCDFIIAATGYKESESRQLLAPVQDFLSGNSLSINRYRGVNLNTDLVEHNCGIWMLGTPKHIDESLAQIATSSRYLADSITKLQKRSAHQDQIQPRL